MKKLCSFLFVLLTGCSPIQFESQQDYQYPIETFEYSEQCPKVCWLGIQPDVTTKEDVRKFLKTANNIENSSIKWIEQGVSATWVENKGGPIWGKVSIRFEKDKVSSIDFNQLELLGVDDCVKMFGEPEEISIYLHQTPHELFYLTYYLYYSSPRVIIKSSTGSDPVGPAPDNTVDTMTFYLEDNLGQMQQRIYDDAQLWLGYGHLEDYLDEEDYEWLLEVTQ